MGFTFIQHSSLRRKTLASKASRRRGLNTLLPFRTNLTAARASGRTGGCGGFFTAVIVLSLALWSITAKNTDGSAGPHARPFVRSIAPLTRSLAPDCSLRLSSPPRSLVRSLAHFAHSLAPGTVNDWMAILSVFFLFSTIVPLSYL